MRLHRPFHQPDPDTTERNFLRGVQQVTPIKMCITLLETL